MKTVVIESHEADGVNWILSFTSHDPEAADCVEHLTQQQAFKLQALIEAGPTRSEADADADKAQACAVARLRKCKSTREAVGNETRAMIYDWLADNIS